MLLSSDFDVVLNRKNALLILRYMEVWIYLIEDAHIIFINIIIATFNS